LFQRTTQFFLSQKKGKSHCKQLACGKKKLVISFCLLILPLYLCVFAVVVYMVVALVRLVLFLNLKQKGKKKLVFAAL